MSDQIKSSTVRILSPGGKVVGAGFLVDQRHIVTCAHVIDGALGREFNTPEQPTTPVRLDFFVAPDYILQAQVTVWHPRQPDKHGDIAGLELTDETILPSQAHPPKLLRVKTTTNLWGHSFRAFGFPEKREFGVWVTEGVIRDRTTSGWLQIETTQSSGYHVQPGFSGGPVWDDTLKAVVGMIVVADEKPRTAFIIPTELLAEMWSQLVPKLVDPLANYRTSLLGKTKYVNLSGIPPLDRYGGEIEPKIPLDKVYIRIQSIERKEQRDREKEEENRLELDSQRRLREQANALRDREIDSEAQDWFQSDYTFRHGYIATLRTLGEYYYRRGEVYQESKRPNPIDPQEALKEHKRLVILGAPGSGKSTMLRYLARRAAEDENGPVPILISLGKYAAELSQLVMDSIPSLNEFALKQASGGDETLYQLLTDAVERQEVLWLLDALDETQSYKQAEIVAIEISRLLGLGQLILTSRLVGYITADSLRDLSHFEVLPLATDDVVGFLYDWFSILAENRDDIPSNWVEKQVTDLQVKLDERPNLQPLMHNPLLLTFMVILAEEDPTQQLPTHRADLYNHFISKLLDRWERTRPAIFAFEALGGDRKEAKCAVLDSFWYLGWRMHLMYFSNQQSSVPNRDNLTKDLEDYWSDRYLDIKNLANDVIDFWMTAGFFEVWHLKNPQTRKSEEFLTFRHLTFQEYAAAEYLLKEWSQTPKETWQFVYSQFHHYAWREVILLMAGRMDIGPVNDLIRRFYLSSQPFSHLTNNLSWFNWIAVMLSGLVIWPVGLILLVITTVTLPIWLPVVITIQIGNKKEQSADISFNRRFISRYFALPSWLARNILRSWRKWNNDSSQFHMQTVLSFFGAVGRDIGYFVIAWLYLWFLTLNTLSYVSEVSFMLIILKRSKNNRKTAVAGVLQNEILQAAAIIVDNPARVKPALAQTIAEYLAKLMQSDIPSLANSAAEATVNVREGLAADIMHSVLLKNSDANYYGAASQVLHRQAEEKKLSPQTAKALIKAIQSMDGEVDWKLSVLSYYDDPPPELLPELLQIFSGLMEHYPSGWPIDETKLRIAQNLTRWGAATPVTISILNSEIRSGRKVRDGTLLAIEQGFLGGHIPVESTQEIIEGLVRLEMPLLDNEDAKKAIQAALVSSQPRLEVSRIAALTMIGLPETERIIDYNVSRHLLAEVLVGDAVSPVIFEVLEQGLDDATSMAGERVVLILKEVLQNENVKTADSKVLHILLKAVDLADVAIKLMAVETISEAIQANKIKGSLVKELRPFWAAARAELENPEKYPWHLWSPKKITGLTVHALVSLIDAGEVPMQPLPPEGFNGASDEIKKIYLSFVREVWPYEIMLGRAKGMQDFFADSIDENWNVVLKSNTLFMLAEAIRSKGGIPESVPAFLRMVNDEEAYVRSPATRGLGFAVAEGLADVSFLPVVIAGLEDVDTEVQRSAAEALASVAKSGKATPAMAEAIYRALQLADATVREYLLPAVRYTLAAGLGWPEWLDTLITLYNEAEVKYVQAKSREIEISKKGVPSLMDTSRFEEYMEHKKAKETVHMTDREMAQVAYALAGAAKGGLVSPVSIAVLLQAIENDNIPNKEPLIVGLGYVLKTGWPDPAIVTALNDAYKKSRYEVAAKTIWALGQAYQEPSLREMVLPTLVSIVKYGRWHVVQAVADLADEMTISSPELMRAAFEALEDEPQTGDTLRLIGRLSRYQPIPINKLNKVVNNIVKHVAPIEWEDYLQGLGYIIQNENCSQDILEFVIATILYAIGSWSIEEIKKPAKEALDAANIIRYDKFETLFTALNSSGDEDWQGPAQIIGDVINQESQAAEKLLSGCYYILQNDEDFFYPNFKERVARLLGFVDSYKNTCLLLQVAQNENSDRNYFKAQMGAVFGLTQIGIRHPDRQAEIISVFSKIFRRAEQLHETEDTCSVFGDEKSLYELKCAIIQAIGNMQNSSLQARRLLQDTIIFPSAVPISYYAPIAVYAAEAIGKLNLDSASSAEITDTLLIALTNSEPRIRNAVWESLSQLEQKARENIIPV